MHEGDLLDWLSVAAVSAAALAALARAAAGPRFLRRFALLAAILGFLAVDDAFGLHERVTPAAADALGFGSRGDALFLVPYLPLLAVAFAILWLAARDAGPRTRRMLAGGLALLVVAVSSRVLAALVAGLGTVPGWERAAGAATMHGTELAAWTLLGAGLAMSVARVRT